MKKTLFCLIALLSPIINADLVPSDVLKSQSNESLAIKAVNEIDEPRFNLKLEEKSVLDKLNTVASQTVKSFTQIGTASWYGRQFHGRKTASGETFNMNGLTAAHPSLPLNCLVRVTNPNNGKSVVVKVNDRGPFIGGRTIDLSYAAAKKIGILNTGVAKVKIERLD